MVVDAALKNADFLSYFIILKIRRVLDAVGINQSLHCSTNMYVRRQVHCAMRVLP